MHLHYLFPFMSGDALSPKAESTSSVVIRLWGLPGDSSSLLLDVRTKLGGGGGDCCFPTLGATNCSCCCGSYKLGAIIVSLRTANIFSYLFIYCLLFVYRLFIICLSLFVIVCRFVYRLFVYRLFVCLSFVCLQFVCLSFVCRLFVYRLFVYRLFVYRSFVYRLFIACLLFVRSFVRSVIRSFIHSFMLQRQWKMLSNVSVVFLQTQMPT